MAKGFWKIGAQHGPVNSMRGWGDLVSAANSAGRSVYAAASDATPADIQRNPLNVGNFISTEDDWGQRYDFDQTIYNSEQEAHLAWQQFGHDRWAVFKRDLPTDHDPLITAVSLENEQRGWLGWKQEGDTGPPQGPIPGMEDEGWGSAEGWQAFYTALEILKEPGYRYFAFAYSGGLPEFGVWETPGMRAYLELCADNPDRLGVALHEYSFNDDLFANNVQWGSRPSEARGDTIFRFWYLFDACDRMGIARPKVQIKEWGWHERHLSPNINQTKNQMYKAAEVYAQYPEIEGCALWTFANGWDDLSGKCQELIPWMQEQYVNAEWEINRDEPDPPDPPNGGEPDPPVEGTNMIKNPCFSEGWEDHPIYPSRAQNPKNWNNDFVNAGDVMSFVNGATGSRPEATGTRESTHKLQTQLPPHEQPGGSNPLIDCGDTVYKMQGVYMVAEERLSQVVNGLEPGAEYKFSIKGKVHYHPNESSIGEPDDIQVRIEANNANKLYKVADLPHRAVEWTVMEVTGIADSQGIMVVAVVFANMWVNSRDLFLDTASLVKVGETDPPDPEPEKIKFVEYIFPQEADKEMYDAISTKAWEDYKRTVGGSVDHAIAALLSSTASSESYAVVWEPNLPSQQAAIQKLKDANVTYEVRYLNGGPPVGDLFKYRPCDTDWVTQEFGENPGHYGQYGLPGHEGIDYGVSDGWPYYAVQDGVVVYVSDRSPSGGPSNYGWHCYVRHEIGGQVFHTVYAHARPNMPVVEGQQVSAGDIVGYSGNTGSSSGFHLHFGLLWPTDTGNGYPMWTYGQCVDPWPYLEGKDDPPDQPPEEKLDLLGYIHGGTENGVGVLYEVRNANGGQERFQIQDGQSGEFFQTKNHLAEQLGADNNWIYRGWDTSPGNQRYYQQQEPQGASKARWLPRRMAIGEEFTVALYVQFYNWDCSISHGNSGNVTDTRKLVAHHDTWTSRAGITLQDVIEIQWVNGGETYFYCRGYGLVGWERTHQDPHTPSWSAIAEIHAPGSRPDNIMDLPSCLV